MTMDLRVSSNRWNAFKWNIIKIEISSYTTIISYQGVLSDCKRFHAVGWREFFFVVFNVIKLCLDEELDFTYEIISFSMKVHTPQRRQHVTGDIIRKLKKKMLMGEKKRRLNEYFVLKIWILKIVLN